MIAHQSGSMANNTLKSLGNKEVNKPDLLR
jgi:hypothetical protein